MSGALATAFVDVHARLSGFTGELTGGVRQSVSAAERVAVLHPRVDATGVRHGMSESEKSIHSTIARAEKDFLGLRGYISNVGTTIAGVFVADKIVEFVKDSVKAAEAGQVATQKLDNSISHNTLLTEGSRAAFEKQAFSIEHLTGTTHVAVAGLDAVLASFKFNQQQITSLAPLVNDLSLKFGIDLPIAARLVGRTASGAGNALGRMGIVIDKTRLKADPFGATLDALSSKAAGFGEQFGTTTAGKLRIASAEFETLKEKVGNVLLPALASLATFTTAHVIPDLERVGKVVGQVAKFFDRLPAPVKASAEALAGLAVAGALVGKVVGVASAVVTRGVEAIIGRKVAQIATNEALIVSENGVAAAETRAAGAGGLGAAGAAGRTGGLIRNLTSLGSRLGPIGVGVAGVTAAFAALYKVDTDSARRSGANARTAVDRLAGSPADLAAAKKRLADLNHQITAYTSARGAGIAVNPLDNRVFREQAKLRVEVAGANRALRDHKTTVEAAARADYTWISPLVIAAGALGRLGAAINTNDNYVVKGERVNLAYRNAVRSALDAVKANGKGLAENTVKGDANRAALLDLVGAGRARIASLIAQHASSKTLSVALGQERADFEKVAGRMGLTKDQADALIVKYGLIPKNIETSVQLLGAAAAIAAAQGLSTALGNIPLTKTVSVLISRHDVAVGDPGLLHGTAPHRATGGWVQAGRPYTVGERGQETITPQRGGFVHPNAESLTTPIHTHVYLDRREIALAIADQNRLDGRR